jgi:hypothetical protein
MDAAVAAYASDCADADAAFARSFREMHTSLQLFRSHVPNYIFAMAQDNHRGGAADAAEPPTLPASQNAAPDGDPLETSSVGSQGSSQKPRGKGARRGKNRDGSVVAPIRGRKYHKRGKNASVVSQDRDDDDDGGGAGSDAESLSSCSSMGSVRSNGSAASARSTGSARSGTGRRRLQSLAENSRNKPAADAGRRLERSGSIMSARSDSQLAAIGANAGAMTAAKALLVTTKRVTFAVVNFAANTSSITRASSALTAVVSTVYDLAGQHGASVHAFVGDQVTVSWNATHPHKTPELSACRFLLELKIAVRGVPAMAVSGAAMTGDARTFFCGPEEHQAFTLSLLQWQTAIQTLVRFAHHHETFVIDAATRAASHPRVRSRGRDVLLQSRCVPRSDPMHDTVPEPDLAFGGRDGSVESSASRVGSTSYGAQPGGSLLGEEKGAEEGEDVVSMVAYELVMFQAAAGGGNAFAPDPVTPASLRGTPQAQALALPAFGMMAGCASPREPVPGMSTAADEEHLSLDDVDDEVTRAMHYCINKDYINAVRRLRPCLAAATRHHNDRMAMSTSTDVAFPMGCASDGLMLDDDPLRAALAEGQRKQQLQDQALLVTTEHLAKWVFTIHKLLMRAMASAADDSLLFATEVFSAM